MRNQIIFLVLSSCLSHILTFTSIALNHKCSWYMVATPVQNTRNPIDRKPSDYSTHKNWALNIEPNSIKAINREIESFFAREKSCELIPSDLKAYLARSAHRLDHVHVLTVMHRCSKLGCSDVNDFIDMDHALAILRSVSATRIDSRAIATILYSLRSIPESELSRSCISLATLWIESSGIGVFSGQAVGKSI